MHIVEPSTAAPFFKYLLMLIMGVQSPRPASPPPHSLRDCVGPRPVAYVELNLHELRRTAHGLPELREAILAGRTPAAAVKHASRSIAGQIDSKPELVLRLFRGTRRIGFWILGFGEDPEMVRLFAVFDRRPGNPLLPDLVADSLRENTGGHTALNYRGVECHRFRGDDFSIWITEYNGRIAVGTDLLSVQSFILRSKALAENPAGAPADAVGAIARAQLDCGRFLNTIMQTIGSYDRDEFSVISAFFDFPAWRQLRLTVNAEQAVLAADIEPHSRTAEILQPRAQPTPLLKCLTPDTGAGVVAALKDPSLLWTHIGASMDYLGTVEEEPDMRAEFEREIEQELAIDIEKDVVAHLAGGGVLMPRVPEQTHQLDRAFCVVAQARSPAAAEATVTKMMASILPDLAAGVVRGDAKTWSVEEEFNFALYGATVLVGPDSEPYKAFSIQFNDLVGNRSGFSSELADRYPGALAWLVLNPSLFCKDLNARQLTAGLASSENGLLLRIDYDLDNLAGVAAAMLKRRRSLADLKLLATACDRYMTDYGRYPPSLKDLVSHVRGDPAVLVSPVTGKPYVYNKSLVGMTAGTVADRGGKILAHDVPAESAGGCAVFLNGRAVFMEQDAFKRALETMK
ncbi:MAG: hypothetical protein R6V03_07180 [Kiritimatiellia bacterium]